VYLPMRGAADGVAFPITFRRLMSPLDPAPQSDNGDTPERRYYHTHGYIYRHGKITVRHTYDHRWVLEGENGDYIQYDEEAREIRCHAPSVFVGTEDDTRIEYQRDEYIKAIMPHIYLGTDTEDRFQYDQSDQAQLVIPKFFMGQTGIQDADGISYVAGVVLHLVSSLIKLTADEIVLDPVNVKLGGAGATEQAVLGNLLLTLWTAAKALFDGHVHTGVQTGSGSTAVPTTQFPAMTGAHLSDVVHISKDGS
jgi:hypothetical protein